MKAAGLKGTSLLHSYQAFRFVFFNLIIGIITTGSSNSMATTKNNSRLRIFKDGDVIIGGLIFLHEYRCDKFSPWNLGIVEAIMYAVNEINKDKEHLTNLTLGYDIQDTCGNEIITVKQAFKFATASNMNCKAVRCISNNKCICDVKNTFVGKEFPRKNSSTYPVIAIVGMSPSRVAIPLASLLQAVRIPYVESAATSEELSSPMYDSFFRTVPSDANQAKAIADIVEHYGWRYVAEIAGDNSYGRHGAIALDRESIQRKTFCVELLGYIPLLDYDNKLKMMISLLKLRKTVKVIIVWSGFWYAKEILRISVTEGLQNRVWIFSEALATKAPDYLSSIHNLSSAGFHILGVKVQSKVPESFRAHLKNRLVSNQSNQDHYLWNEFWKYVDLKNLSRESSDQLLNITYDDYAIYTIDAVYSIANALDRMLRFSSPINKELCPDIKETLKPGKLIENLKKVEFEGVSGKIQFDSRGDLLGAIYDVVYFNISKGNDKERITKNVIGQWSKTKKVRISIVDAMQWKNENDERKIPTSTCTDECKPGQWKELITNCCWKCLPCIDGSVSETNGALSCTTCTKTQMSNFERTRCIPLPMNNIDWSDIVSIILTIISILGFVIDVCIFGILFYFRDTPMVKALNKVCTLVLLLGITLCFGMTISYIVRPSSELCSVLKPLRYIVYTLCCSALFLKTMQIVHAFNISRHKNWVKAFICSTQRQVIVLLVLICIEVLLGVWWIIWDPLYAHVNIFHKSHVFITCVPFRGTPGKVLDSLMLAYLLLLAGCCIYYAFHARNLPAYFNEAKHISFSLYIFLLSWIIYYPVDYAGEGWYVAVLSAATLLLSSYGLLGCIFGPKLSIIVLHPEKNTIEFIRAEMRQNNMNQSLGNISSSCNVKLPEA